MKLAVRIPVAVKLSPFFTNMANMAARLDATGADALVLFNRFYQPDIDLENLIIRPNVLLSTPQDLRLPLTWIGILYGRIKANLAATSGIHHAEWIHSGCFLMDGDKMRMLPGGIPEIILMHHPRESIVLKGNWDTLGLRGTGSHDAVADEVFVPDARVLSIFDGPVIDRPLYRFPPFGFFAACITAAI